MSDYRRDYHATRPARQASPHSERIAEALEEANALNYSRAICDHIAWYVQRKITEFEATHQLEAPPHITAILGVARSIAAQHPPRKRHNAEAHDNLYHLSCRECGKPFVARSPTAERCERCRYLHRREQKRAWYQTPQGRAYRVLERARAGPRKRRKRPERSEPIIVLCVRCSAPVAAKTKARKYCNECRYIIRREYGIQWGRSAAGRASALRYRQSAKGHAAKQRELAKRQTSTSASPRSVADPAPDG